MDSRYAQHATAVAREIVRLGLSDQGLVRQLYQEYTQYLQQGVEATFTQLLLSRGVIDQQGFQALQSRVPLGAQAVSLSSSGALAHSAEKWQQGGDAAVSAANPPLSAEQTTGFDQVLALERSPDPDSSSPLMLSDEVGVSPAGGRLGGEERFEVPPSLLASTPSGSSSTPASSYPGGTPAGSYTPGGSFAAPDPNVPAAFLLGEDTMDSQALERDLAQGLASEENAGADPHRDFIMSDSAEAGAEQREPSAGDVIGAYKLLKTIGRGGMGVIYKAQKAGTEEIYALKLLMGGDDKASDRRRQRFRREIEAMRRLEHEHIVGVYDYGRLGNFDWYVMDYVEGRDFEKVLEDDELEPHEKMQVYFDICEAMAHAHERSVIHRDLKPQNVIVDAAGHGHVLDFGLAKIMDQGIGMTRTGSALGTPYYMAPEQLRSAKHIDSRADVFSLGVILFEISTGERPFNGNTAAEVGTNILNTEAPRPTAVKKSLHPDIDAMVIKALEKDPERRYQDASELLADLIRHRKGFGVGGATGVTGAAGSARRWAQRNRAALIGAGVAAAVLVPALLFLAVQGDDPAPRRRPNEVADADPQPQAEDPPAGGASSSGTSGDGAPTTEPDRPPPEGPSGAPSASATSTSSGGGEEAVSTSASDDPAPVSRPPPDPRTTDPRPAVDPIESPAASRTPLEKARLALAPPDESGPSGADQVKSGNTTRDSLRQLIHRLYGEVLQAMAVGDLERADAALDGIRRDPNIHQSRWLVKEVENDIQTLQRLRRLVCERIKQEPKALRRAALWGGERLAVTKVEVLADDHLKITDRNSWAVVDPCSLDVQTLEGLAIEKARGKDKVDNTSAHYALSVLEIYRGGKKTKAHLDRAGDSQATQRRRRTSEWLPVAHKEVSAAFESDAENAWRLLEKKKDSSLIRGLEDFVKEYGRTKAFADRRKEWLGRMVTLVTDPDDLLAGKYRKGGITWNFKGDEVADFTLGPFKPGQPFRAEAQSSSLVMHNGRVQFFLTDLKGDTGAVEVSTNDDTLLSVFLRDVHQEIDPDAGWVIKHRGKKVAEETRGRKMAKAKQVSFEVKPDKRVYRIKPKELEVPASTFRGSSRGEASFGAEAVGHLRLTEMTLAWNAKEDGSDAKGLRLRLLGRKLLLLESQENCKPGKGALLLQRSVPGSLRGFGLVGEWSASRREMVSGQGAVLWTTRRSQRGVFELEYAADDGPGVTFQLGVAPQGKRKGEVTWALPNTLKTEPNRFRKLTCLLDLQAKLAVVIVDGMWLTSEGRLPTRAAYCGLSFEGRTKGKVRDVSFLRY